MAERYAARHAAWHAKKRSHLRPKRKQLLPAAAALTVAGLIVGSAGAAMQLHSSGEPKADSTFTYDPADYPPPDRDAASDRVSRGGARPQATPTTAATTAAAKSQQQQPSGAGTVASSGSCEASFYDDPQGTASGEVFNPEAFTAANKTLPFNTRVRVTNIANGKSVIVRINDRGPYVSGRCLDLSRASFRAIASLSTGVVDVRYEVLA